MGFWKSRVIQKSCDFQTPYSSHFLQYFHNLVTCEYIDFYLTAQYLFLYYGQCTHKCQVKVSVLTCEYIDLNIVPSPPIYMRNCSTVLLVVFNNDFVQTCTQTCLSLAAQMAWMPKLDFFYNWNFRHKSLTLCDHISQVIMR